MADGPSFMGSLTEDDINLAKEAGFDISKYVPESSLTREGYRPVEEADYQTSWSDYGRALTSGGAGVVSSLAGGTEYLTGGALGGDTRRFFEGISKEQVEAMSPVGRRALQAEFLPSAGETSIFDNFTSSLGLKTVAALPSVVSSIIPAGIAAKALQGASLATRVGVAGATARGTAGLQAGGDVAGQIYSTIEKMSDAELQDKAPIYAGYRSMMPEAEARRQYMNEVAGAAPAAAFLLSAALGGAESQIAGRLAGGAAAGFLRGVGRGAAAEAAQETVESGGGELLTQIALADQNLAQLNWQKVLSKGLEGGLVGGVLGGGVGGVTNIGRGEDTTVVPPPPAPPAATAPAVVPPKGAGTGSAPQPAAGPEIGDPNARPTGSETQYPKGREPFTIATVEQRLAAKNIPFPEDRRDELQARVDAIRNMTKNRNPEIAKFLNELYALAPAAPGGTQTIAPGVQVGNGPDAAQTAALGVSLPVKPVPAKVSTPAPAPAAAIVQRQAAAPAPAPVAAAMQRQATPVDTGTNLQQPSAELLAEQQDLVDGRRSVQMFPTNTQPLSLPKGMKEVVTARGIFHFNPKAKINGKTVNKGLIERLSALGRENELLGLGDRTKQEVAAKAPTEGGVTTVNEVTPEGNRVRSVAATVADAERQAQMLQEQAAPENTVVIEPTEETLAPRAPQPPAPAPTAPRVLEDISPAGKKAKAIAEKADKARRERIVAEELAKEREVASIQRAEAVEGKVGTEAMLTKDEQRAAKIAEDEKIAAEVVANNQPTAAEDNLQSKNGAERKAAMQAMYDRLKKMVSEAEKRGVSIPERQRKQADDLILLMRAKKFLAARAPAAAKGGLGTVTPYRDFVAMETSLRGGREAAAAERARAKGEAEAAKKPVGEAPEGTVTEERGTLSQAAEEAAMTPEERMLAAEGPGTLAQAAEEAAMTPEERAAIAEEVYASGRERELSASAAARATDEDAVRAIESQEGKFKVAKRPVAEKFRPTVTGKISLKPKAAAAVAVAQKAEAKRQAPTKAEVAASIKARRDAIAAAERGQFPPGMIDETPKPAERTRAEQFREAYNDPYNSLDAMRSNPDLADLAAYADWLGSLTDAQWAKIGPSFTARDNPFLSGMTLDPAAARAKFEAMLGVTPQMRASVAQPGTLLSSYTDEELANGMTKRQNRVDGDQSATEVDRVLDQLANRLPPDLQDEYFRLRTEYAFADATDAPFALGDLVEFLRANDVPQMRASAGRPLQRANYRPVTPTGNTVTMAGVEFVPIQTTDVSRTLRLTSDDLYAIFRDGPARLFATFFKERMTSRVGNIPVYVVTYEDMARLYSTVNENGERVVASGLYHNGKIALRADVLADPVAGLELAMHEALHAWSEDAINSSPQLREALDELVEVGKRTYEAYYKGAPSLYGLTDRYEFISEAFSNPEFRDFLASVTLSSATRYKVEQAIGPVKGPMKSAWDAFIQLIRSKMGLGDTLANYTMLDAVMHAGARIDDIVERRGVIGDRAMVQRPTSPARASLSAQELINGSADRKKAFTSWGKEFWAKIIPNTALRQQYADTVIGPALKRVVDAVLSTSPRIRQIKAEGDALATRAGDLSNKYRKEFRSLTQIMEEARMMDVSIEGQNFFEKNPKTEAIKYWQAKARLGDLRARFSVLPPELKQLYRDMAQFYRDSHNDIVKSSVTSILEELQLRQVRGKAKGNALTEQQIAELTQRVMDQEMTAADKALLGETIYTSLENAAAFHRITGDYFPLMRYGDYVVVTSDQIKDTMGGKLETPDTVLFRNKSNTKARDAAENFVAKSELRDLSVKKVYFDNTTNTELQNEDEAKSYNDVDIGYRVVMQTKGVYFFESRTEAEKFVRTNPEGHDVINNPEKRMGSGYEAQLMSGTQVASLNDAIDSRVKSGNISSGQGELIKSIVNQAAIRMLGGNRIASRRLKSQKVTGASQDVTRNLLQYNAAAAAHIAVAESAPVIRDGLAEMSNALKTYSGDDRAQLVAVVEEVKARIDQGIVDPNAPGKVMKDVMTYAFLARLFSPAYTILQGMQVSMVTVPILGGRFGNIAASTEVGRAYGDIGFGDLALQGALNTARAAKQTFKASLLNTDDIVGSIRKKVSAASDGADVLRMMDEAIRLGAIDGNAGLEITNAAAEGRGKYGQTLAGVDRIARQLPQMMEAVNRSVSGIAAYRLARKNNQTHEQATQFAIDTIQNTQGDYSAANSPRFFNNPVLRPALMFKKYALMMTYLLGDMVYRSFKGATPEEKQIALKQLVNILGVQILVAGAFSLPGLEILKVAFLIMSALGLSGGWDEQEDKLRKLLDDSVGKTWGEMISSGLLSRAFGNGIDLSQRMSLADMWLFGEPKGDSSESMQAYMFRQAVGAPGGYLLDVRDAIVLATEGELGKAAGKFLPAKFLGDFAKAAYGYSEAKYENPEKRAVSGLGEAALNTLGFRTGRQAELGRERGVAIRERQDQQKEFKKLQRDYYRARTKGDMIKAIAKNREWNANLSKGEFRMKLPIKPRDLRAPQ